MDWIGLVLAACGSVLGFVLGVWVGHRTARPRLSFYPHQQTGVALRRRLFGDRAE